MKRFVCVLAVCFLTQGCVGSLHNQSKSQHPVGWEKMAKLNPICVDPNLKNLIGCMYGAEILEAPSPEKATSLFLKDWESDVFRYYDDKAKKAEKEHDVVDATIYGNAKQKAVKVLENITVPALQSYYQEKPTDYSKKMSRILDTIYIDSISSFYTFREAHLKALMN